MLSLPTLVLKALRDLSNAASRSRVAGICQLIESFRTEDFPLADYFVLPDILDYVRNAGLILTEFIDCSERFIGRGSNKALQFARLWQSRDRSARIGLLGVSYAGQGMLQALHTPHQERPTGQRPTMAVFRRSV